MKRRTLYKIASLLSVVFVFSGWQGFQWDFSSSSDQIPIPRTSAITFQLNPATSLTPSIGTSGSFARASSVTYGVSTVLFGTVTSGNPALPAFAFGGSNSGSGVQIQGARTNQLFHSKTFGTTQQCAAGPTNWTNTGTFSVDQSTGATGPDGASGVWQLTATSSPSGKICNIGIAAANNTFTSSVYVKSTFGGNVGGSIIVEGTGGTPETTTFGFTATGTWQRVSVSKAFSAGATGNVQIRFQVSNGGTSLEFDDAQLEQNNGVNAILAPSPYVPSTSGTAVASSVLDNLNYPGTTNLNETTGSLSIWVNTMFAQNEGITGVGKFVINTHSVPSGMYIYFWPATPGFIFEWKGGEVSRNTGALTFSRGQWQHLLITWSLSGGNLTSAIYRNGVVGGSGTNAATALTEGNIQLGGRVDLNNSQSGEYIIGRTKVWNVVLNSLEAKQVCLAEKGFYGLASCN